MREMPRRRSTGSVRPRAALRRSVQYHQYRRLAVSLSASRGLDVTAWIMVASVEVALTANGVVRAQSTGAMGSSPSSNSIVSWIRRQGRREAAQRHHHANFRQQRCRRACIDPSDLRRRWPYGVGIGDVAIWRERVIYLVRLHDRCPCLQFDSCGSACGHTGEDAGRDRALCGSDWDGDHGGGSLDSLR